MEGDWVFSWQLSAASFYALWSALFPFSVQGTWRECKFPVWVSINFFLIFSWSAKKFHFVKLYIKKNYWQNKFCHFWTRTSHFGQIYEFVFGLFLFIRNIHFPPSWLDMWYLRITKSPLCEVQKFTETNDAGFDW